MKTAKARLVKRHTSDGLASVEFNVPIGREYTVNLDSRRTLNLYNVDFNRPHTKEVVDTVNDNGQVTGWFPTELLQIDDDA